MPLVIWGRANSVNVQKVLWCCDEMAVGYERIDAGGAHGVVNTPEYRKMNPNGLIPTIVDDGFILWESNAIVRYLAAKHGAAGLWPQDARTCADADRWMDWTLSTFWPLMRPIFLGLVRTPPEHRDPKAIEDLRQKAADTLVLVDAHLATHSFLAGDVFTMGDIPLGCAIWRWFALTIERPRMPHLERWFDTLAQRPAYKNVVMQPLS